ncbi:MAG: hypothetical protein LBM25_02015 [Bacteroidales bacterium]|jgi:uncharacterized protein involved in exopolysaccharide biosynthesis|nr:hypothetical protein [Bacteroidales bacterium]
MRILQYIAKVAFKRKWYLIIIPIIAAIIAALSVQEKENQYVVTSTIFTGFGSSYSIESDGTAMYDKSGVENSIENLINIIKATTTLERVSLRLYAEHMMYGDSLNDNNYIQKNHYTPVFNMTPKNIRTLIDKKSISNTVSNLRAYSKPSPNNFVYGLFNWNHPYYSYKTLSKILVTRLGNSDMMEISFTSNDPGIAYNTVKILNDEFQNEYFEMKFGETDSVIAYFRSELLKAGERLKLGEDELTKYNVDNRIINYEEQTTQVAYEGREINIAYTNLKMDFQSSKASLDEIENRMDINLRLLKSNAKFIQYFDNITQLNYDITSLESIHADSSNYSEELYTYRNQLREEENKLNDLVQEYSAQSYSKEGLSVNNIINEWFNQLLTNVKTEAKLKVMEDRMDELNREYARYSPVGSTIKRYEREIGFHESTYLNYLHNLNTALMRRKNLQMTESTLRIINPPIFPLNALPSTKKLIVLGVLFGTLLFIMIWFTILELIDRTPKNQLKGELLTGKSISGAFPFKLTGKYRRYRRDITDISNNFLFNNIVNKFDNSKKLNIVNVLSTESSDGKSFLAENIYELLNEKGIKTKFISHNTDFDAQGSQYLLANTLSDFCDIADMQVVIVEYPPLKDGSIPTNLTKEASVNLFIANAKKAWKYSDQMFLDKLLAQCEEKTLMIYLNNCSVDAVEEFVGLLPPYSFLRKLFFKKILEMEIRTK